MASRALIASISSEMAAGSFPKQDCDPLRGGLADLADEWRKARSAVSRAASTCRQGGHGLVPERLVCGGVLRLGFLVMDAILSGYLRPVLSRSREDRQ